MPVRVLSLNHILSMEDFPGGKKKYLAFQAAAVLISLTLGMQDCPCSSGGEMVMGAESQPLGSLAVRASPLGSWLPSHMGVNKSAGVQSALTIWLQQIGHRSPN